MRRGNILVIDDEPAIGRSIARALRDHDVETEVSGERALDRLRDGATYDVILCDLMMPSLSGMEVYAELCRIRPDQAERVVFTSGGVFAPEVRAFLDGVPNPKLQKPFDLASLRALVNERVR